ncbi:unnamed protein product, partial [Rotaria magnacalcarata]
GKRGGGGGSNSGSGGKDTIDLTDSDFQSTVLDSDDAWLVEFSKYFILKAL